MAVRTRVLTVLTVLTVLAIFMPATPSNAITGGQPDGSRHPYVGLMEALDANGVPLQLCSGSLVSPTVFLTAGHCVSHPAAVRAEIWFDPGPIQIDIDYLLRLFLDPTFSGSCYDSPLFDGYPCQGDAGGTTHPHPDFCFPCGTGVQKEVHSDVAVIKLDEPVGTSTVSRLAQLPQPGTVDALDVGTAVDLAGYGVSVQYHLPGKYLPAPPPASRWTGAGTRLYAPTQVGSRNFAGSGEFLRLSLNGSAARDGGGLCFGDSGGPDLLGGTDTVLAVNSYLTNYNCKGNGYSQRVDVPDVLTWIRSYM